MAGLIGIIQNSARPYFFSNISYYPRVIFLDMFFSR